MPRLLSFVLRRSGTAAVLLALIAVSVTLPARHVLLPAWPERVEEVLAEAGPGRVERLFLPAGAAVSSESVVVARSQPIELWRIEGDSGEVTHAWLAGLRDAEGALMPKLPAWSERVRVDGPLPDGQRLVVITADHEKVEIDAAGLRRMLRPNAMSVSQRGKLWVDRLGERWKWPLTTTADARMTPLAR
ncbi:MAG: hypothetical protein U5L08_09085 [Xanthomonadales bacterium]|nr:hypothetical protein [Xanthomonadales bacterium]